MAGLALLSGCGQLPWQAQTKAPRIGWLGTTQDGHDAFREGLAELGYVEGRTVTLEWRGDGQLDRLPGLTAELVGMPVDVLVASGAGPIQAAIRATSTIPIVMAQTNDPVEDGFVASLARPGGNVTGLTGIARELIGKRLEVLRQTFPSASRVDVIWNSDPGIPNQAGQVRETEAVAGPLGLEILPLAVREPAAIEGAFGRAVQERVDALTLVDNLVLSSNVARVGELALAHRLPMMSADRRYVAAGGLLAYGANRPSMYRRAATYVDKILKGANPGDLPVERPTALDFVVNLKTARALGLTIPPSVLSQVTEIIQ